MDEVDVIYMNLSAASPQANPDKYTTFNSILASTIQPTTLPNDVHQFESMDNNGNPIITTDSYHSQNSEPIPKIDRTKLSSNNNNSPKLGSSLEVRQPMKSNRKSLPTFSKLFESEDKEIHIHSRPKFRLDTDSNGSTSRGSSEKDGAVPSQGYSNGSRDINRNGASGGAGIYGNNPDSNQSPSFKFSISQMKKAASSTLLGTKIDPSLLLLRSKKSSNSTNGTNSSSNFSTASLNSYSSLKSSYLKANQNPSLCVDEFGFIQGNSDVEDDDKDHWNESTLSPKNIDLNSVKEGKWLTILETWTPHQARKSYRVKKLLEAGAPEQMRGQIWMFLANTRMYYKKGKFEELLSMEEVPIFEIIERDINRTYPKHVMFSDIDGDGQKDLNRILKAYAQYNPEVGYCQGMGMLVGLMLMQGLNAEETFWLLVATIDQYLQGYYSPSLTQVKIHCEVFDLLLAEEDSKLAKHLKKNDVSPLIYITQWFLTVFTMTLPWPSVLRVWDLFYFKGNYYIDYDSSN
jgi:hypothetical protein